MYILSALFKDARLGEDVLQYAEKALILAINGFDSVFWNVRNSSTLLFSSLINRIFGTNRSKGDISKKNRWASWIICIGNKNSFIIVNDFTDKTIFGCKGKYVTEKEEEFILYFWFLKIDTVMS